MVYLWLLAKHRQECVIEAQALGLPIRADPCTAWPVGPVAHMVNRWAAPILPSSMAFGAPLKQCWPIAGANLIEIDPGKIETETLSSRLL